MRRHRGALPVEDARHVDDGRDERLVDTDVERVVHGKGVFEQLGGLLAREGLEALPAHGGCIDAWCVRELGRACADAVHLDVVGVAVPASLVVGGDDFSVFLVEDRGQTPRRLFDVGGPERPRLVVRRRVDHAGILVAEELHARDAEELRGAPRFFRAPVGEYL